MQPYYTHGSSRIMTPERRAKPCELIAESHTLEEASEAVGVSIRTVQRDRALRTGPAYIKLGKKIFYRPAAIEAWLLANEQQQVRSKVRA